MKTKGVIHCANTQRKKQHPWTAAEDERRNFFDSNRVVDRVCGLWLTAVHAFLYSLKQESDCIWSVRRTEQVISWFNEHGCDKCSLSSVSSLEQCHWTPWVGVQMRHSLERFLLNFTNKGQRFWRREQNDKGKIIRWICRLFFSRKNSKPESIPLWCHKVHSYPP